MSTARLAPRFRGEPATSRSQHLAGAAVVAILAALGAIGLGGQLPALALFAVGAGAGYSLSGSV
jgi:hypothetical protein